MTGPADALIICRNLKRTYPSTADGEPPLVLAFPDVEIRAGRRYALLGISGSGKSTFLNLVAGLDRADGAGSRDPQPGPPPSIVYRFADGVTADMADPQAAFPRDRLGFVFQEGHLISDASVSINAGLPGLLNGIAADGKHLEEFLQALQLPRDAPGREVWRLSGGQKQRVALLRALLHGPQIIFADEPTSSLDRRTAGVIMRLLKSYQEQDESRTLFWATHDLALAREFATDFLIVRRNAEGAIELKACGRGEVDTIEDEVYAGNDIADVSVPLIAVTARRPQKPGEVPYTEAKVGSSLTFARRDAPYSLSQVGRLGRWLGSVEGVAPPLVRGATEVGRLYRRFSDHAVAAAVGLSILMLSFVFLGLWMMNYERAKALSDPTACHVVAQARDIAGAGSAGTELNPQMLARMNQAAPWSSRPAAWAASADPLTAPPPAADANPCGEAQDLVFGRNTTELTLGTLDSATRRCRAIDVELKTLVASFREPAIMATDVELLSGGPAGSPPVTRKLGDVVPQAMRELQMQPGQLTGDEIFVTDAVLDVLAEKVNAGARTASDRINPRGSRTLTPAQLAALPLCIAGKAQVQPLRIGGIVSGLPQRRGLPYMALVANSSNVTAQTDTFQQAVFYTRPARAADLGNYLRDQAKFGFSAEDIQRMTAAAARFTAIGNLILIVGGIMIAAAFFFLFTCVGAFMEKNARPNAVLRAYGLTKGNLRRQIFWRLGAVSAYALAVLAVAGVILGTLLYFLFQSVGLTLPALSDVAVIFAGALAATLAGMVGVVYLSVGLWWRKHESIAQELG
jgi:putative ABC transport system ATP-binding protein